LRHIAGPRSGERAPVTVVQEGHDAPHAPGVASAAGTLLFRWPRLFAAGGRSKLTVQGPDGTAEQLLWSDSPEYERLIEKLRVKPQDAVRIAWGDGPAWGVQSVPNFIVGHWYHVATDHVIGQAALGGTYVNGETGEVVRHEDGRVIRFDTFEGDRLRDASVSP
jgi:hypothetical protein